ncbi:MAG TPA: porin [Usitatibacter sp.]|nr:porin [Usitatibacter sp.]
MDRRQKTIARAVATAFAAASLAGAPYARADDESQREIRALKEQIEMLSRKVDELSRKEAATSARQREIESHPPPMAQAASSAAGPVAKPGNSLTWNVGGGEVTLYGHVDVSLDEQNNGMTGFLNGGLPVTGHNGWVPDISSNLSYFGVRGQRPVTPDLTALFQFETEVAFAATPGASDQAPDGTQQKFSLGSRNSFIGMRSGQWGTIYLGKTDTPYKTSTGRLDPFASTPGDYNAIMGNSGGDNRAEFDSRLSHSAWYESPKMGPWSFGLLFSPGQNRSTDTELYAQGEPDCTGGNSSAGLNGNNGQPNPCEDGSFGNAFSSALRYQSGPLYAIAAYEIHKNVNRKGDEIDPGTIGVRDEMAAKIGVQYTFPTHTTVDFIVERLKRDAITPALDERTHTATWLAVTQHMTAMDDLNLGWAHVGHSPGQPDQGVQDHLGNANGPGSSDNGADLLSIGYKHRFGDNRTTWYATYSRLKNEYWGHYSLGAGGHGLPTRNYVGDKFIGGCSNDGNCGPPFTGNTAQAFSIGMTYDY